MEVTARARHLLVSPTKMRRLLRLIAAKPVAEADGILANNPSPLAATLRKLLASARANAENNHNLNPDEMYVARAFADGATILKRFQARARGRANRIRKRMCHVTLVLAEPEEE